jgi:hypothetical protein
MPQRRPHQADWEVTVHQNIHKIHCTTLLYCNNPTTRKSKMLALLCHGANLSKLIRKSLFIKIFTKYIVQHYCTVIIQPWENQKCWHCCATAPTSAGWLGSDCSSKYEVFTVPHWFLLESEFFTVPHVFLPESGGIRRIPGIPGEWNFSSGAC